MVLTTVLSMLTYVGGVDDRDFIDRLHAYFTTNLLIALSILVSFKQFGGRPIECMVPETFTGPWEEYAESYCWAQDTYYVPFATVVAGMPKLERHQRRISYYQWVPFFLLIQAACFRLPSLLWKYMAGYSGIKIHEIVKLASDTNNIKPDIKVSNIKALTAHLQGALCFHRRLRKKHITPHKIMRLLNVLYSTSFVAAIYLLTKLFYLINVCLQLFFMNKFLATNNHSWYGFGVLTDILNGTTWEKSGVFPRVTLCDFDERGMGNERPHTIQCVLVINMFNEKIFVFLWFWYVGLVVLTTLSVLFWMAVIILPSPNKRLIARHMDMSEMPFDPDASRKEIDKFLSTYLKRDGAFIIRMITMHSGVIFATELVLSLWQSFYRIEEEYHRSASVEVGGCQYTWPPPPPGTQPSIEGSDNHSNFLRLRKRLNSVDDVQDKLMKKLLPLDVPPNPCAPHTLDEPDSCGQKSKSTRFANSEQNEVDDS
uniref:Innexin n=1 Tax=Plectus sambesii TaxID=2011161 RepID=A0A914XIV4_9BILA